MNYHKKVQLGGELGAELERMWEAIRSNQIKTSPGQRINRTPSGTTVSFSANQVSATVQGSAGGDTHGKFLYDVNYPSNNPRGDDNGYTPFMQLGQWFAVDGVEQLVMMPPKSQSQGGLGHTVYDHFYYEGRYWPETLRTAPIGRGWYFTKQLYKNESYPIGKFRSPLPISFLAQINRSTTVIAAMYGSGVPVDPNDTIKYFMRSLPPDPLNPSIVDDWSWDSGP